MEKVPNFNEENMPSSDSELDSKISYIRQKVEKFSEVSDANDHNGMDQHRKAIIAGYGSFDDYADDAKLLYEIETGAVNASEAIAEREEKKRIERLAKQQANRRTPRSAKKRRLTSDQYMLNDIAEARAREMARMRAQLEAEEAEDSENS